MSNNNKIKQANLSFFHKNMHELNYVCTIFNYCKCNLTHVIKIPKNQNNNKMHVAVAQRVNKENSTHDTHLTLKVEPLHFTNFSLYFSEENTIQFHVAISFIKSFIIINRLDLTLFAHVRSKKSQTHVHGSSVVQGSWSFNTLPIRAEGSSLYPHSHTHESDCKEPQYSSQ